MEWSGINFGNKTRLSDKRIVSFWYSMCSDRFQDALKIHDDSVLTSSAAPYDCEFNLKTRAGRTKRWKKGLVVGLHEHWHGKSRHAYPSWTAADSWNEIFESRNQQIKESRNQKATFQDLMWIWNRNTKGWWWRLSNHGRSLRTDNVP